MKKMLQQPSIAIALLVASLFLLAIQEFVPKYRFLYSIGHKVTSGETLWSIANEYQGLQDKDDVREFIYDIRRYNQMDKSPHVYSGQIIEIPIYKKY